MPSRSTGACGMEAMIDPSAAAQRNGVLGSLNMVADA
jgi:hypothetical protein